MFTPEARDSYNEGQRRFIAYCKKQDTQVLEAFYTLSQATNILSKRHQNTLSATEALRSKNEFFESFITIYVGDKKDREMMNVNKYVATQRSPFLKAAFNGADWIEKTTQEMTLEDVEPKILRMLVEWMYTSDIDETSWKNDGDGALQIDF
jgi:hypothetical protein